MWTSSVAWPWTEKRRQSYGTAGSSSTPTSCTRTCCPAGQERNSILRGSLRRLNSPRPDGRVRCFITLDGGQSWQRREKARKRQRKRKRGEQQKRKARGNRQRSRQKKRLRGRQLEKRRSQEEKRPGKLPPDRQQRWRDRRLQRPPWRQPPEGRKPP